MKHASLLKQQGLGFYVSAFGTIIILLWVGAFKLTAIEAQAIQPLVQHHFLSSWMYDVFSMQMVSNIVGAFEIIIACALIIGLKSPKVAIIASLGLIVMFLMTLSYLFTTPGMFKMVDGAPAFSKFLHTDFFILKDIMYLGFGITLLNISFSKLKQVDK